MVGVGAGNSTPTIILRALCVLLVSWPIGFLAGCVAQWAIVDHINKYKREHPIPDDSVPDS